ncbi:MAG: hypothetical protein QNJ75_05355 [Acidimicrobiia bacterium]|nr:hypothetical protein [Acidimicrobiia bacterium]
MSTPSEAVDERNRPPLILAALALVVLGGVAVWFSAGSDDPDSYTTTFTERCASTGTWEDGYEKYRCMEVSPDPRWEGTATLWYSPTGSRFELTTDGGIWSGTSRLVEANKYAGSGVGSGGYEGLQYSYEGSLPRPITFTVTVEPIP